MLADDRIGLPSVLWCAGMVASEGGEGWGYKLGLSVMDGEINESERRRERRR